VFMHLNDEDPIGEDARALLADWLRTELALCVTPEIYVEIDRHPASSQRNDERSYAQTFVQITVPFNDAQAIASELRALYPKKPNRNDISDMLHTAYAILGDADFLVTRDQELLDLADQIELKFNLAVVSPVELIVHLDELNRVSDYQPARLSGSSITIGRIRSEQIDEFVGIFQNSRNETKGAFRNKLMHMLASPLNYQLQTIESSGNAIGLVGESRDKTGQLQLTLLRVVRNSLEKTLYRHLLLKAVQTAATDKRLLLKVIDDSLSDEAIVALQELSFAKVDGGWLRLVLPILKTTEQLLFTINHLTELYPEEGENILRIEEVVAGKIASREIDALWEVEKMLWPAKLIDLILPCFVVPIRPYWAEQLFDDQLANQTLFGAKPELVLNRENVYYRSARPNILNFPARILWYVSDHAGYRGAKHIRAYSRLDEVMVAGPKDLYKLFRRLGVYEWEHIFAIAGEDIQQPVMAIRFSDTELFEKPVSWDDVQQILEAEDGHRSQFQSPTSISSECFWKLYQMSMR
jgi:predicted nucleic acid-binding protein